MALSNEQLQKYAIRLKTSRMRLLVNHSFYGMLLMHLKYSLDLECQTAYTDGEKIAFSPSFMDELSDGELDFVMMHEIMHVALLHCFRGTDFDKELFNIACDIVVNSNILLSNNMDKKAITLNKYGESMHLAPDGNEGHLYTAEEVYKMLEKSAKSLSEQKSRDGKEKEEENSNKNGKNSSSKSQKCKRNGFDDHSKWQEGINKDETLSEVWVKRVTDIVETVSVLDPSNARGLLPLSAKRLVDNLKKAQTDWRTVLNNFIQEDITDYSFSPPDKRFDGFDFYLPDFNEKDETVKDVLFMIDTSGSMSNDMIRTCFSEIKGAIESFNGKLQGLLGFFDAAIYPPEPFNTVDEMLKIPALGGGGTSFEIIFKYVEEYMLDNPPTCIVVLTDGYAPFPEEKVARDIPVLWIINNEEITPPWGKVARVKSD
ncbi:MAG: hypothetical protein IJF75_02350 [Clostridia bacterium]|nr:hypothetical protein [Clostridia bacterium]